MERVHLFANLFDSIGAKRLPLLLRAHFFPCTSLLEFAVDDDKEGYSTRKKGFIVFFVSLSDCVYAGKKTTC